jgi:transposase
VCLDQLVVAFGAHRNAVGRWLSRWQRLGLAGLAEGRRTGRPPKLPEAAQKK